VPIAIVCHNELPRAHSSHGVTTVYRSLQKRRARIFALAIFAPRDEKVREIPQSGPANIYRRTVHQSFDPAQIAHHRLRASLDHIGGGLQQMRVAI